MSEPLHIISLGAGVQSSTMALMAAKGKISPMPVAAIFADTGAEPASVYKWLNWIEGELPYPVHRVSRGDLWTDSLRIRRSGKTGRLYMEGGVPAFVMNESGKASIVRRQCTSDYKIVPIQQKTRGMLLESGASSAVMWIGISTDEALRMKPSRVPYITHLWPLIDAGMTRGHCLEWMAKNYPGRVPPRSACVFCPYHSDAEWSRLRREEPEEFERAAQYERELQDAASRQEALAGQPFLHRSLVPIGDVLLNDGTHQSDLFDNECDGMCGV